MNQWASIKKTFQYRGEDEEQYEVKAYKEKATRADLKKSVLPSMYQSLIEKYETSFVLLMFLNQYICIPMWLISILTIFQ